MSEQLKHVKKRIVTFTIATGIFKTHANRSMLKADPLQCIVYHKWVRCARDNVYRRFAALNRNAFSQIENKQNRIHISEMTISNLFLVNHEPTSPEPWRLC